MNFDYEIENDKGEVVETLDCEAEFAPVVRGRYEGPPEHCYPDEGGELEGLTVRVGRRELTPDEVDFYFGPGTYRAIERHAVENKRFQ